MRIPSKTAIAAISITLVIALVQTFWTYSGGEIRGERIIVSKVYDGDTIVVGRGWRNSTVRLIGVDTPETVHPDKPVQFYGPEASDFTRKSLLGQWIKLEFESPDRPGGSTDRYGRILAYIITQDGRNFSRELIRFGYGKAYTRYPFRYMKQFKSAEREARSAGLGIWAEEKRTAWENSESRGKIIGNIRSNIYHLPGQYAYSRISEKNRIFFYSEKEAQKAGYRKAKN